MRLGVPQRCALVGTREAFDTGRRGELIREFRFGRQDVRTLVFTVVDDLQAGPVDALGSPLRSWRDDPFDLEASP